MHHKEKKQHPTKNPQIKNKQAKIHETPQNIWHVNPDDQSP